MARVRRGSHPKANVLILHNISKDFAGLRALDHVSLKLHRGEILGLIGPNGSGKTTLINILSGLLAPTSGSLFIDGTEITRWPAHRIARAGVARTYQAIKLFRGLTVLENVEVALVSSGWSRAQARQEAHIFLEQFGLARWSTLPAAALPYGAERSVEIARALALNPSFLLLDEPAAGLNEAESDRLLETLAPIPAERDCGILIVDHDMRLILRLCTRLHVLNYGQTVAEGSPAEVRHDPAVIEAYLGSSHSGNGNRASS